MNKATDTEAESDSYDTYINAELKFPNSDGNPVQGVVRKRIRNNYGEPVYFVNCNPLLDTSKYELQYLDGFMENMASNQIADNTVSKVYP